MILVICNDEPTYNSHCSDHSTGPFERSLTLVWYFSFSSDIVTRASFVPAKSKCSFVVFWCLFNVFDCYYWHLLCLTLLNELECHGGQWYNVMRYRWLEIYAVFVAIKWSSNCFSLQRKGKLFPFNLPFFPFVFSPFALFTGDEKAIETRQKAI